MNKKFTIVIYCMVFFILQKSNAQLLAFPTAEGAGKFTTGGRSTVAVAPTIYEVTNLTDVNTAGSFRYACTNGSAARIVIFRISGTIHLTSALALKANTTIAGQTAPRDGICIADYPVTLSGNNIIVRYIRFRLGDKNQAASIGNDDAFGDNSSDRSNIVVDHCTMSWSNDEAFTVYHGDKITLQWNFITEPLDKSYHDEGSGVQNHAYGGIESAKQISIHHNLYAHLRGRAPRFDGLRAGIADTADYRNNVIYNWADYNVNGGEGGTYNIVNNYYKYGPSTPSSVTSGINRRNMLINPYNKTTAPTIAYGRYYLTGNYCDNSTTVTNNNWLGAAFNGGSLNDSTASKVTTAFNHTPITMQAAVDAYFDVLANAGCALPHRDTLDERIVNDVKNRTGKLIDCQGGYPTQSAYALTQNAWPTLANGIAQTDTDHDGMPDNWETARGLAPSNAADRNTYQSTSGYNNVENYINGDTIVAVGIVNTCITAKSINSTNTGLWLHARDTTFSGYLNNTYTSSTDSNHIVASILDNGNFGAFNISYYTANSNRTDVFAAHYGRRNITITPSNPALITQPVTVRFYLSLVEFNALKAADPSINTINDIQILKSEDNSCVTALPSTFSFIIPVGNAVFGTYSNGYYVEFQTSSFSTFYFQSKFAPIPVKLSYFNVKKQGTTTAIIDWKTEQEINSKHFILQRSTDAQNWQIIATIAAVGNSSTPKAYSFIDNDNKSGLFYYRLIQVDIDGKTIQSEIRKLNFSSNKTLVQLYPNPAKNMFKIYVAEATNFKYTVTDAIGRKVLFNTINTNNTQIDISTLQAGIYLVQVEANGAIINSKLFIQ